MTKRPFFILLLLGFILLAVDQCSAQERYTSEGRDRWTQPLELEEMQDYSSTLFAAKNFEQIQKGMTEEEVLELLGIPADLNKVKRPKNRWTISYFYPDGHVVNFRNGLVVGKEKRD